jgi:hypothetical protein
MNKITIPYSFTAGLIVAWLVFPLVWLIYQVQRVPSVAMAAKAAAPPPVQARPARNGRQPGTFLKVPAAHALGWDHV